jgi:cytochrome P450
VIADLANPLPVVVIGDILSLPSEDRDQFKRWSDDIIAFAARLGADQPGLADRALRSTSGWPTISASWLPNSGSSPTRRC